MKIMFLIPVTANFEQKKKEIVGYLKNISVQTRTSCFGRFPKGSLR